MLRSIAGHYTAVLALVMTMLTIEHLAKLLDAARSLGASGRFVLEMMGSLLPEYAALGMIFALYLSVALTFRRMALHNELDVWFAAGVSPARLMAVPVAVSLLTFLAVLAIRFSLQPAGAREIDALQAEMRGGDFGFVVPAQAIYPAGGNAALLYDHLEPGREELRGLFISDGSTTISAASGRVTVTSPGVLALDLHNGLAVSTNGGAGQLWRFAHMTFQLPLGQHAPPMQRPAERLDRDNLALLLKEHSADTRTASIGQIGERAADAALALVVPWLALYLGPPPRRGRSSVGLMAGMVLIVAAIKAFTFSAQAAPLFAAVADCAVLTALIGAGPGLPKCLRAARAATDWCRTRCSK